MQLQGRIAGGDVEVVGLGPVVGAEVDEGVEGCMGEVLGGLVSHFFCSFVDLLGGLVTFNMDRLAGMVLLGAVLGTTDVSGSCSICRRLGWRG